MKLFWRCLCDHPGVLWGWLWPLMVAGAVANRKDFVGFSALSGAAWLGLGLLVVLPWVSILWTAWTGRHQYEDSNG